MSGDGRAPAPLQPSWPWKTSCGPAEGRLHDFYIPALQRSVRFDRATGPGHGPGQHRSPRGQRQTHAAVRRGAELAGVAGNAMAGSLADASDQSTRHAWKRSRGWWLKGAWRSGSSCSAARTGARCPPPRPASTTIPMRACSGTLRENRLVLSGYDRWALAEGAGSGRSANARASHCGPTQPARASSPSCSMIPRKASPVWWPLWRRY